jgi:hypothetical protein
MIVLGFTLIVVLFSMVYYWALQDAFTNAITFDDALLLSVSTQTLLGIGHIQPANTAAKLTMALQTTTTFVVLVFVTFYSSLSLTKE